MSTDVTFAGSTPALVGGASSRQEKRYITNDGPGSQLIGQFVMIADVLVGLDSVHTSHTSHTSHMFHACFRSG